MGTVLLVGMNNPYGDDPEFALYCRPPGCAGDRLRRIFGLAESPYLALQRVNLCEGVWSMTVASPRAKALIESEMSPRVVVLLGREVANAFRYARPFFTHDRVTSMTGVARDLVSLPHPSGRVTLWNKERMRERARELLREVAPEVPWGRMEEEAEVLEGTS